MRRRLTPALALLAPVLLVLGLVLGAHPASLPGPVRDAIGAGDQAAIQQAIDTIHDRYYREIPRSQLADRAIGGMVESLDDQFSSYFTPEQYERFLEQRDAQFSGVGLSVAGHPRGLRVRGVYDGSPAGRAGIRPGDLIVRVRRTSLRGVAEQRAVELIRGVPGTDVTLVYERGSETRTARMTRAKIDLPVVASRTVTRAGRRYAVIALAQFSSGAHGELAAAVRRALGRRVAGIALDLRGNPGGLVREAQLVASVFIERGPIVTTQGRRTPRNTLHAVGDAIAPRTPLVTLVDRRTASAAEIVAGALQDDRRARLVGTRTFGKGVFQEVIELDNGGALDITAGQYFTPSGRNLGGAGTTRGGGLRPDIAAPDDPDTRRDETLDRALRAL